MLQRASSATRNPLSDAAHAFPIATFVTAGLAARALGAAFVLFYAVDQYQEFDRTFPATWVFAITAAAIAIASALPLRNPWATVVQATGAAVLLFAGAALAREPWGIIALLCGIVAWLSVAAIAEQRAQSALHAILGLVLGAGGTIFLAIATALVVSN